VDIRKPHRSARKALVASTGQSLYRRAWEDARAAGAKQSLLPSLGVGVLSAIALGAIEGDLNANTIYAATAGVVSWLILTYVHRLWMAPLEIAVEKEAEWSTDRAELAGELSTVKERLAVIEASPRPKLSFVEPRLDERVLMADGTTQAFVFGGVKNSQSRPGHGETASRAHLTMSYHENDGATIAGPFPGRWREAPPAHQLNPFQMQVDAYAIDIHANESIHEFDIATLIEGVLCGMDAGQNVHPFESRLVIVVIELKGANFPTLATEYLVQHIAGHGGIQIEYRGEPR
jgi:hypothetical protein